jgi:putative nucleotidyltransferase with HDIG domain
MKKLNLMAVVKELSRQNKTIFIHGKNVARFACAIARKMCFSDENITIIEDAAIVHDIGKTQVSNAILNKPAALNRNELVLMRKHPELGYQLLQNLGIEPVICQVALQHHERLDGSGYPHGLYSDKIIPSAKIVAVADVVDTMVSPQVYRSTLTIEDALQEIKQNSGLLYDPEVVAVSLSLIEKGEFRV